MGQSLDANINAFTAAWKGFTQALGDAGIPATNPLSLQRI